jgi:nicotinamidase-related amidase
MPSDHHDHEEPVEPPDLALDRNDAMLLVIDVQERLFTAMPEHRSQVQANIEKLIKAAKRLGMPVVATEQYPKGLGPTVGALKELLPDAPLEKLEFSCGANKAIARHIFKLERRQVIVAGMESHVCVFQTVRDLLRGSFSVFLPRDAVISRAPSNQEVGISLCEKAGAVVTSTETVIFDLLGIAGTPEFKELSSLVK